MEQTPASCLVLLWGNAVREAAHLLGELPEVLVLLLCAFQHGNMYPPLHTSLAWEVSMWRPCPWGV